MRSETQRLARTVQRLAQSRRQAHELMEALSRTRDELQLTQTGEAEALRGRDAIRRERDAIVSSTSWRATAFLRSSAEKIPKGVRRLVKAGFTSVLRVRGRKMASQ